MFGLPSMFYLSLETRYPLLSKQKVPVLLLLLLSFAMTITGLFSAIAYQILPGFDEGLSGTLNCTVVSQ